MNKWIEMSLIKLQMLKNKTDSSEITYFASNVRRLAFETNIFWER